jgi:hypothetical protein
MIPDDVFLSMVRHRAMIPGKDDKTFIINFKIVEKEFPAYLEFLVKESLNIIELAAYIEGYMTYSVLDNGMLRWEWTGKPLSK